MHQGPAECRASARRNWDAMLHFTHLDLARIQTTVLALKHGPCVTICHAAAGARSGFIRAATCTIRVHLARTSTRPGARATPVSGQRRYADVMKETTMMKKHARRPRWDLTCGKGRVLKYDATKAHAPTVHEQDVRRQGQGQPPGGCVRTCQQQLRGKTSSR